jgi:hypothetical protein
MAAELHAFILIEPSAAKVPPTAAYREARVPAFQLPRPKHKRAVYAPDLQPSRNDFQESAADRQVSGFLDFDFRQARLGRWAGRWKR